MTAKFGFEQFNLIVVKTQATLMVIIQNEIRASSHHTTAGLIDRL